MPSSTPAGTLTEQRALPWSHGRRRRRRRTDFRSSARGRVTRERTLSGNDPTGIEDGTRIRLTGEGEAGMRGGPPGDLYIFLTVKPHGDLSARRRRPLLPGPDLDGAGGARRRVYRHDARWNRVEGQRSRGRAVRPPIEAARQGHAGLALARFGGSVRSAQCRDAAKPHAAPARAFDRVRRRVLAPDPPRKRGLLRQDKSIEGRG